jgi:hypothetical protein
MTEIHLNWSQMAIAMAVAGMRNIANVLRDKKSVHGEEEEGSWQRYVEGCFSEIALARYLGMYWDGKVGDPTPGDVGDNECRVTNRPNGRVIVHDTDPDDARVYLLIGLNGKYKIVGWMLCKDAKRPEWWKDPTGLNRHAYFAPQSALNKL